MGNKTRLSKSLLASAACLAGTFGLSHAALASGFGLREGSADALGTAFAGGPAKAYSAATAGDNPAGMALLGQDEIQTGISYISPNAQFSGSNSNPLTGGNVLGVTGGNAIQPAVTGALYGVVGLAPDWRLGLAVTSPFGERSSYPGDFVGRYQSLTSAITDINVGLALSYKINDHLSIGGGPNFDYFDARLTQNLNVPVLSAATFQDPAADVHGNNIGVGYNLGALYQFDAATRIGIDYRSRIQHNITGSQTVSVPPIYTVLSPATAGLLNELNSGAKTSITLPDIVSLGIYHQITPQWAVMGSVEWTDWSLFNQLNITATNGSGTTTVQENWRNSWFAGIGTNYQVNDRLMLQTGFAYDESPVTNANRTTRVPDADHYDIGFGVQYAVLRNATLQFAYGHVFSPGGTINNTASPGLPTPSGTITGKYSDSDNSFTAGLDVKF
jgi:long-chain fatty acid transport protein